MKSELPNKSALSDRDLRDAYKTLIGFPAANEQLEARLRKVAELISKVRSLPSGPCLIWEEKEGIVRNVALGNELIVGRQPGEGAGRLALPEDKFLGRQHFAVRRVAGDFRVEDLNSRNGIAVNDAKARTNKRVLRDGDLIFAGDHIFVYLFQRSVEEPQ